MRKRRARTLPSTSEATDDDNTTVCWYATILEKIVANNQNCSADWSTLWFITTSFLNCCSFCTYIDINYVSSSGGDDSWWWIEICYEQWNSTTSPSASQVKICTAPDISVVFMVFFSFFLTFCWLYLLAGKARAFNNYYVFSMLSIKFPLIISTWGFIFICAWHWKRREGASFE